MNNQELIKNLAQHTDNEYYLDIPVTVTETREYNTTRTVIITAVQLAEYLKDATPHNLVQLLSTNSEHYQVNDDSSPEYDINYEDDTDGILQQHLRLTLEVLGEAYHDTYNIQPNHSDDIPADYDADTYDEDITQALERVAEQYEIIHQLTAA
jgi:hypothetical protein